MDLYIYVLIFCTGVVLNSPLVFGESSRVEDVLPDIRDELNNLKLSNERNERKIMSLERQVNECHAKYEELTKQSMSVAPIEQRLADIEEKVEASQHELLTRLEVVEMASAVRTDHNMTNADPTTDNDDELKPNIDTPNSENVPELADHVKGKKSSNDKRIVPVTGQHTRVAFTAHIAHQPVLNTASRNTLPFNSFHINEGNAFNPNTHLFTCPVSGVYYFTSLVDGEIQFRSTVYRNYYLLLTQIVRIGMPISKAYSRFESNADIYLGSSFNSGVTVCNKGEDVWVEIRDNLSSATSSFHFGDNGTSFSGFLLWEF